MSDDSVKSPTPALFRRLQVFNVRPVRLMIATFERLGFEPFTKSSVSGVLRVDYV